MKKIAFVFTNSPHGSSSGREGLDALLATSALTENIGVFFIADGVFHLLPDQQPELILSRNYISTFGILALYDINKCYVCAESLQYRGLKASSDWIINAQVLSASSIHDLLKVHDSVLTF